MELVPNLVELVELRKILWFLKGNVSGISGNTVELSEMLRCLKALRRREKAHEDTKDAIFFAGACRRQINHFDITSFLWDLVK